MRRSPSTRGFTLIELLTVMVIILVLAALVLALVGYGQTKAARSKAEGEIAAMSSALESYKTDNGTYPRSLPGAASGATPACDSLDAQKDSNPSGGKYIPANAILYRALTGDTQGNQLANSSGGTVSSTVPFTKIYYTPPASELISDTTSFNYIADPFGNAYGYSTAYQADVDAATASGSNATPTHGFNPTFDLWSTGGYGSGARAYPASMAGNSTTAAMTALWIKNW